MVSCWLPYLLWTWTIHNNMMFVFFLFLQHCIQHSIVACQFHLYDLLVDAWNLHSNQWYLNQLSGSLLLLLCTTTGAVVSGNLDGGLTFELNDEINKPQILPLPTEILLISYCTGVSVSNKPWRMISLTNNDVAIDLFLSGQKKIHCLPSSNYLPDVLIGPSNPIKRHSVIFIYSVMSSKSIFA